MNNQNALSFLFISSLFFSFLANRVIIRNVKRHTQKKKKKEEERKRKRRLEKSSERELLLLFSSFYLFFFFVSAVSNGGVKATYLFQLVKVMAGGGGREKVNLLETSTVDEDGDSIRLDSTRLVNMRCCCSVLRQ